MALIQYVVVQREGRWMVMIDGQHYGPYESQNDALRVAINVAQENGQKGQDSQVIVREREVIRTAWTYGHDPYPFPGKQVAAEADAL
jgi:hypothetical protein